MNTLGCPHTAASVVIEKSNGKPFEYFSVNSIHRLKGLHLADAMEFSQMGKLICLAKTPYVVIYANRAWTKVTGVDQHEMQNSPLSAVLGGCIDVAEIINTVDRHGEAMLVVDNTSKASAGRQCMHSIKVQPVISLNVYEEPYVSHFLLRSIGLSIRNIADKQPSLPNSISDGTDATDDSTEVDKAIEEVVGIKRPRKHESLSNLREGNDFLVGWEDR